MRFLTPRGLAGLSQDIVGFFESRRGGKAAGKTAVAAPEAGE